ncbi:hypothetical protein N7493_002059 [Penicillium malachiteum]|uniref:Lipocalin-like domain-containing protein n=1 Tax=Penicillium malachiteum TaxID=1324776 RepID=A0AAD6N084_9EURO|nr:hypothetical protein N7493_002059 [Penicillium malachiteum]
MHISLSIGAVFALCGKVYSQNAWGTYNIRQVERSGPTLYLGFEGPIPLFQDENHQSSQVWNLAPAGEGLVMIQNTETGDYINCGSYGGICELKEEGQVFRETRRYEDHDIYSIVEQLTSESLVRAEDGTLSLVRDPDASKPELRLFWLTRVQCK